MKNPNLSTKFVSALIILTFICSGNVYSLEYKDTLRKPIGSDALTRAAKAADAASPALASGQTIGGIAEGVMTAIEHEIVNGFLGERNARREEYARHDLEDLLEIRGEIRIQSVPEMFRETGFRGHWAVKDGIVYIDKETLDNDSEKGIAYARHMTDQLKLILRFAAWKKFTRAQLVDWLERTGNPFEVRRLLTMAYVKAAKIPSEYNEPMAEHKSIRVILSKLVYLAASSDEKGLRINSKGEVRFTPAMDSQYFLSRQLSKGDARMFDPKSRLVGGYRALFAVQETVERIYPNGLDLGQSVLTRTLQGIKDSEISIPQHAAVDFIRDTLFQYFIRPVRSATRIAPPSIAVTTGL
ncbi:MAG: hypothetical protein Q8N76_07100 [Candidatus Omnitrophota bacterium]|nr:hypothetical protein [Candidatus Omnitrophota bacterium]